MRKNKNKLLIYFVVFSSLMMITSCFSDVVLAAPTLSTLLISAQSAGSMTDMVKVTTNIYAFVTIANGYYGKVITKNINDVTGVISSSNISTYIFDSHGMCKNPHIIALENNYFAIIYSGIWSTYYYTGKVITLYISNEGVISAPTDYHTFTLDCLNVEHDIFYDSTNNILTCFYEGANGKIPYLQTMRYYTSNNTIREIGSPVSLYQWNGTGGLQSYGTHITAGKTYNIYTDFYAVVNTYDKKLPSTYYSNFTVVTFNISSSGSFEYCNRLHKAGNATAANYTSSCISRLYNDKNFITVCIHTGNYFWGFSITNQTGQIQYTGYFVISGAPNPPYDAVPIVFQTGPSLISVVYDWDYSGHPWYLLNFSVSGTGALTYVPTAVTYIINPGTNTYNNFNVFRMTGTKYLFCFTDSTNLKVMLFTYGNFASYSGQTETPPTTTCDFSGYSTIGRLQYTGSYDYIDSNYNMMEMIYRGYLDANVLGYQLIISNFQYEHISNNLNDYILYVNGVSCSHPTSILPYWGGLYIMSWCGFSIPMNNHNVVFEISCNQYDSSIIDYMYWLPWGSNGDTDSDGSIDLGFSSTTQNPDGLYNPGYIETMIGEPSYIMYTDIPVINNETSPFGSYKLTSDFSTYPVNTTIPLYWFVNSTLYTNYLYAYKGGVSVGQSQGYPLTLNGFDGRTSFVACSTGEYTFKIRTNSANMTSLPITVTSNPNDNFNIWVRPEPSLDGTVFTVFYRYFHAEGKKGLILLSIIPNIQSQSDAYVTLRLNSNITGNFTFSDAGISSNVYYINMYHYDGNGSEGSYSYIMQYVHYISCGVDVDKLSVSVNPIIVGNVETFTCQHKYIGSTVYLRVDNAIVSYSLGTNCISYITRTETVPGLHTATITLETLNGSVILDTITYQVNSLSNGTGGGQDFWSLSNNPFKYVFAVGILFMFILIPMTVASKLGIDLPAIANFASGAIGMSFCVLYGFLPIWTIFITIIAMVFGIIVLIFTR